MEKEHLLNGAKNKDINAFNELFGLHEKSLKSYLYRLLTNRHDVEDFYHNTFVKAFDKIDTFKGNVSQFKSWVFTIATNLSLNFLKRKRRWNSDASDKARDAMESKTFDQKMAFFSKIKSQPFAEYEVKEHIDFCFTCVSNTLPYQQQLALLLKEVYHFKVAEISSICELTLAQTKHALLNARNTMKDVFDKKCALINKQGTCHQCSELMGIMNPKKDKQQALIQVKMIAESENKNQEELLDLRMELIRNINPLYCKGADLHDALMQQTKLVNNLL